jgi:hypothetical protein
MRQTIEHWRGPRPARAERKHQRRQRQRFAVRRLCLRPPKKLDEEERRALQQVLDGDSELALGHALVQHFAIVKQRDQASLDSWLAEAVQANSRPS